MKKYNIQICKREGKFKMKKIDYTKLSEITVKSQEELDEIPLDFKGRIYIEFGTHWNKAVVKNKYYYSVVARENSSVVARENSSVKAMGNSSVVAWENSSVEAMGNSSVEAMENSSVVAWENSSVVAWGNSSVEAMGNSSVVALENSSVVAIGNTQVVDRQINGKINISGNTRIVYMPKNINDFMDFYGIKHTKTKAIFYKAVRKEEDGTYHSDYRSDFIYEIGKYKTENCDDNIEADCSYGIHICHRDWAINFGKNWSNLAIIEVETKISDIVLPKDTDGKVRTSKIKVLREVPLDECGIYGKIIAKRRKNNG